MIREVWRSFRDYAPDVGPLVVLLVVISILGGLAESASLLLIVRIALSLGSHTTGTRLPILGTSLDQRGLVVIAFGAALFTFFSHMAVAYLDARVSTNTILRARKRVVDTYLAADWATQTTVQEGALQDHVVGLASNVASQLGAALTGISQLIMLITFVISAFLVSPLSALSVLVGGGLLASALYPVSLIVRRFGLENARATLEMGETVGHLAATSLEARVFGVSGAVAENIAEANAALRRPYENAQFIGAFASGLFKDIAVMLLVAIIAVLALADVGKSTAVFAVITLVMRALASAQQVNGQFHVLNAYSGWVRIFYEKIQFFTDGVAVPGTTRLDTVHRIVLDRVSYSYSAAEGDIALREVSLAVEHGDTIGVVGPSGGGKSTLVQVLLRLRPPTSGVLLVNGTDYREYDEESWAARLAIVPQDPSFLLASIADNIAFYRSFTRAEIEQAARAAHVHEQILELPHGYDTVLGPRGLGLSGGQRQRVAIARALIGRPNLLIMDEPTSALDQTSEELVTRTLAELRGSLTTVIVAHRPHILEVCDRIYEMDHGRLALRAAEVPLQAEDPVL